LIPLPMSPGVAGGCTSALCIPRHLLPSCKVHPNQSRQERPDRSLPAFAWGDIALQPTLSQPHTGRRSLSRPPLPRPHQRSLRFALPRGQGFGLTVFHTSYTDSLGPAFPPVTSCPCARSTHRANPSHTFWSKPASMLGLSILTAVTAVHLR